jgi:sugar O-acyltransferase (sialic acid O-acetyltransferase NeuD family)
MSKVVLYGTGQVASVLYTYLTYDSPHEVVAFTVEGERIESSTLLGLPVVPFDGLVERYSPDEVSMLIAVGFQRVNRLRAERYGMAKELGYELITYIHSSAITWPDLVIGDNCVVMEQTVIQPYAVIGDDVTLGPGSCVGHHSAIGDHCLLASHVDVSGNVRVGDYCFLGANSTLRDGIIIGQGTVVGANVAILRDTGPNEVHVGPRARILPIPSDKLPRI